LLKYLYILIKLKQISETSDKQLIQLKQVFNYDDHA